MLHRLYVGIPHGTTLGAAIDAVFRLARELGLPGLTVLDGWGADDSHDPERSWRTPRTLAVDVLDPATSSRAETLAVALRREFGQDSILLVSIEASSRLVREVAR